MQELNAISNTLHRDDKEVATQEQEYVLPRPAWNDQVAFFRALVKTKKALDLIEENNSSFLDLSKSI